MWQATIVLLDWPALLCTPKQAKKAKFPARLLSVCASVHLAASSTCTMLQQGKGTCWKP